MSRPAVTTLLQSAPLTLGLAAAAVLVSGHWWTGNDIDGLVLSASSDALEPWRYFTSALPHVSAVQLIFNIFLFVYFGIVLERGFGSMRFFGLFAVLAAGSSAAEFALGWGGAIGLSAVLFGFFTLVWTLSRRDERFRGTVGAVIAIGMIGLLAFYVVATMAGTFLAANFGHVAGALLGAMLGEMLTAPREARARWGAAVIGSLALIVAGAVAGRPHVNLMRATDAELSDAAIDAAIEGDYATSIELFRRLIAVDPHNGAHWFNLGKALAETERFAEAVEALERAVDLEPANTGFREWLLWSRAWWRAEEAMLAYAMDDFGRAESLYRQALAYDNSIPQLWHGLGHALAAQVRYEPASTAFRRALDLDPLNHEYRRAAEWAAARHLVFLANLQFLEGDYERATALYRRALRADETVSEWWYNLGLTLVQLDRLAEARTALGRALALDPEDGAASELLEWVHEAEGDFD